MCTVMEREPSDDRLLRAEALRTLLQRDAREVLATDDVLLAAIEKTYLAPEAKQLSAAGELNLSHSTYRRRLRQALERLATELELRERHLNLRDRITS
jgi:hypothetical protein